MNQVNIATRPSRMGGGLAETLIYIRKIIMQIGELKKHLSQWPDDMDIDFEDGDFGGRGEDLGKSDICYSAKGKQVLIDAPHYAPINSEV